MGLFFIFFIFTYNSPCIFYCFLVGFPQTLLHFSWMFLGVLKVHYETVFYGPVNAKKLHSASLKLPKTSMKSAAEFGENPSKTIKMFIYRPVKKLHRSIKKTALDARNSSFAEANMTLLKTKLFYGPVNASWKSLEMFRY